MGVRQIETGTEALCEECDWHWKTEEDWSDRRDPMVRQMRQKSQMREAHAALDAHQAREHAEPLDVSLEASLDRAGVTWGSGVAWPVASPRRQRWYDLDAGTAAALMVLAPFVAAVGGVAVLVARRFRVVRR